MNLENATIHIRRDVANIINHSERRHPRHRYEFIHFNNDVSKLNFRLSFYNFNH